VILGERDVSIPGSNDLRTSVGGRDSSSVSTRADGANDSTIVGITESKIVGTKDIFMEDCCIAVGEAVVEPLIGLAAGEGEVNDLENKTNGGGSSHVKSETSISQTLFSASQLKVPFTSFFLTISVGSSLAQSDGRHMGYSV